MSNEEVEIEYPEPEYALVETSLDKLPAIVVVNKSLQGFQHRDVYGWYLSVIIFASEIAENGMPTSDECQILNVIGDEIEQVVLANYNALFFARQTWNEVRQLVFYVYNPDEANEALQALLAQANPRRPWEFQMEHDPSWSFGEPYLALLESID